MAVRSFIYLPARSPSVPRVTVSVDPHVHSEGSYDGHEPVELILEHAAEIGLDAVVVTDHDVIRESNRAAAIAPEYGLIGIPGVEVSTAHGHLLAIGVDQMPPRGRPYDETVRRIHEQGGVAVVPHPFQRSRHGVRRGDVPTPESDEEIDAIEAFNAWLFTGNRNRRARRSVWRRNTTSALPAAGRRTTRVPARSAGLGPPSGPQSTARWRRRSPRSSRSTAPAGSSPGSPD